MRCLLVIACLFSLGIAGSAHAKAKPGRYQVNADGTVYDTATQLTWQQAVPAKAFNWSDAKAYCLSNIGLPGAGWHLPNILELLSIVDLGETKPAIDPMAFPKTPPTFFWSATPRPSGGSSRGVYFQYGFAVIVGTANAYRVRCVR